jgi:tRNA (guanine37-N1)-methyltransferase
VAKGAASIAVHDLRDWTRDKHRSVDDYPFGGGAGMVMRVDVFDSCLAALSEQGPAPHVVLFSARGERFSQDVARELAAMPRVVLLCGHYKGVDERVASLAHRELSIGDYVLSGGEVPAMVVMDAVIRLLPGVVGDFSSVSEDSHYEGVLSYPEYTRPREYKGMEVPEILLSGDHARIARWRREQALEVTRRRRPDLYRKFAGQKGETGE